jgi:hypothetical protein
MAICYKLVADSQSSAVGLDSAWCIEWHFLQMKASQFVAKRPLWFRGYIFPQSREVHELNGHELDESSTRNYPTLSLPGLKLLSSWAFLHHI